MKYIFFCEFKKSIKALYSPFQQNSRKPSLLRKSPQHNTHTHALNKDMKMYLDIVERHLNHSSDSR